MPVSTMMPDVVVEIAFTTGPNDPAPVWVDVSAYVEADTITKITRGRSDELTTVQPGRLTITLDNRDGRFTPQNTASPYYPNVKKGRRIRVRRMRPLATSYVDRISGYIDEWPVSWPDGTSATSTVTITGSSRTSRLGRGVELRSIIEEEYLSDNPTAYYPYGDPAGTTKAGNISTLAQPPMQAVALGSPSAGAGIFFGQSTGPGTDDLTAPLFTRTDGNNGFYMRSIHDQEIVRSTDTSFLVECFFNTTTANTAMIWLDSDGGAPAVRNSTLGISAAGKLQATGSYPSSFFVIVSAATVTDGATHHAALRETTDGTTITSTLYLDGAVVATSANVATWGGRSWLRVGGLSQVYNGTLAHIAVYSGTTEITTARILQHATSGLTGFSGERSDQRIVRLASYAGVPASEVVVETGLSTSLINQLTNGKMALALMNEVVDTEGGALFDARDGDLTFHARSHRYNASSVATLSATNQEIEDDLQPKLDDQGLLNDITAVREGGISTRSVDQASILDYGLYRESITLLTTSDSEVQDAANWKVQTRSTPSVRISGISVDLLNCSSGQKSALLALEFGDRITLTGLPPQAPASTMSFFIEGDADDIGPESWRLSFNLSPATLSGVWQLDSSTYSVLDSTTRLAY